MNEVATALVVKVTKAQRAELNDIPGMILILSGQFNKQCYSIDPENFEDIEAALEHGQDVCVDIFGREHKEKEGFVIPIVQAVYDVEKTETEEGAEAGI